MPKRKKLTIYQYIIEKFIGNSKTIWSDREATKREISTAKKLLKAYPDKKFWFRASIPFDNLESLIWFLSPNGKRYLVSEWHKYKLDLTPEKSYDVESRKFGRAKKIKTKKNLLDFLRDGSKKKK
jgi:hypothetical protein